MVTLKDIAKEAGVSVMTVSNIVNGNYSKVSKEKAEHIQEIISRMGYVPNASARSLAKNKTNIIAVIMRGEENENPMLNPYYSAMVGAMIQKIQQHGYYAMVNIMKSRQDIVQSLRTWNVDGAIFLGLFDDEIEAMYSVCDVPMVFVDSYSNVRQLSNIGIDDFKGGQLAANCFISRGHRSVAFIGPTMKYNGVIRHRFDGFASVLRVNGMEVRSEHIFEIKSDVRQEAIIALGKHIASMKKEFFRIFITSDQIASYIVQGLTSEGVSVPGKCPLSDLIIWKYVAKYLPSSLPSRKILIKRPTSQCLHCFSALPIRPFLLNPWCLMWNSLKGLPLLKNNVSFCYSNSLDTY